MAAKDTEFPPLARLDFHGAFPNLVATGSSHSVFYFRNHNELKFVGDFDFYGKNEVIRKKNGFLTIRFDPDFQVKRIEACRGTFGMVSEQGEAIIWPFRESLSSPLTQIRLQSKAKVADLACGDGFVVVRLGNGKVAVMSQNNIVGELGNGTFDKSTRMEIVKYFVDNQILVDQVAAGPRHIVVLSNQGDLFGWGSNFHGQVGSKPMSNIPFPRLIPFEKGSHAYSKILRVICGKNSTILLLKSRQVGSIDLLDGLKRLDFKA
jgi:hypothetical protein